MRRTAEQNGFVGCASRYCRLVEHPAGTKLEALVAIRGAMLDLYAAALHLPEFGQSSDSLSLPEISNDEYDRMVRQLAALVEKDHFELSYRPFRLAFEAPVVASLSDGLADIWRDLRPGLNTLQYGETITYDIFWEWKFGFDHHWGDHAVDCIWAIHKLLRDSPPAG